MAYTQADLDAIDAEITKIRTVKTTAFGDQSTTFRDLEEMYRERQRIAAAVSVSAGTPRNVRYASTSKGV